MDTVKQNRMKEELACGLRCHTESTLNKLQCDEIGYDALRLRCILLSEWQVHVFPDYLFVKG